MLQRCATSKSHCPCIWLRGPWIELRNPLFLRLFRSKQKQMKDATETVKVRDTWDRKSWGQWYLVTAWNCRAGARSTLGPCAPSSGVASGSSLTPQEISRKMKVKNDEWSKQDIELLFQMLNVILSWIFCELILAISLIKSQNRWNPKINSRTKTL